MNNSIVENPILIKKIVRSYSINLSKSISLFNLISGEVWNNLSRSKK